MPSILFVCTGNQCRSPVAAELLIHHLEQQSLRPAWRIESAGTWATFGRNVPSLLIQAGLDYGIDLRSHRARRVDDIQDLAEFDLIVTMERNQKEALEVEFPQLRKRIHLFTALTGLAYDVGDPMGGSIERYRASIREIDMLVRKSLPRLTEMAQAEWLQAESKQTERLAPLVV